jgi:hypothetical protein
LDHGVTAAPAAVEPVDGSSAYTVDVASNVVSRTRRIT